ncbi:MAG TPA: hypothetical protein PKY59_18855 [Pyrinomonadaceae bacterium]|nr:hypothetical protein [Pyrinomonadaceae bacterium]
MNKKEYPMDEDYNRAAAFLAEMIAERDEMKQVIKDLPPAARPEALRLLGEFNQAIEEREQKLAEEYEATQNYHRALEERDTAFDELTEGLAGSFVHIKYRLPEKLPEFEAIINNMEPEDAQNFYDRAAILESGDLISIIAQKGETREQTEEFLRNYRAAEKAKESPPDEEKEKEYPMDDDYNQKLQLLTELIAERDKLRKKLVVLSAAARPKALQMIDELDKAIEKCEQALANRYEAHQNLRRAEEKRDDMLEEVAKRMKMVFIHIKYRHPEKLEEIRAAVLNDFTPEEEKEFYEGVAHLEETELISLIAQQGETREETEEFLRTYRASAKAKQ